MGRNILYYELLNVPQKYFQTLLDSSLIDNHSNSTQEYWKKIHHFVLSIFEGFNLNLHVIKLCI